MSAETKDYHKLRIRIKKRYATQAAFAKAIGISTIALSKKMTGKNSISQQDIILWCDLLGISRSAIGEYFYPDVKE